MFDRENGSSDENDKWFLIGMLVLVWIIAIILAIYCICCRNEGTDSAEFKEYEDKMMMEQKKEADMQ